MGALERDEDEVVQEYRTKLLSEAGYEPEHAEALGGRFDIDLHHAIELVEDHGCPPATAARILL